MSTSRWRRPESESDDDEDDGVEPTPKRACPAGAEPTAKRARELRALSTPVGLPSAQTLPADKVPREELQRVLASAEVKRILRELEECTDLKLPADCNSKH